MLCPNKFSVDVRWFALISLLCLGVLTRQLGTLNPNNALRSSRVSQAVRQLPSDLQPPVRKLVRELREAGGVDGFGPQERSAWAKAHPCRSRAEMRGRYARRMHDVRPNPQWEAVLTEYSKLHRSCLHASGNLTDLFSSRNSTNGCRFLVVDVMVGAGLGNKVLVAISNILYAVLTKRVVLVASETLLTRVFCEPFEGSSWRVDNSTIPYPPASFPHHWQKPPEFYRNLDTEPHPTTFASAITYVSGKVEDQWHPRDRFYCNFEQERYAQVPWLYVTGCLYTLPKLFAIDSFRPILEALFPDRMALTHLLRSLMLPSNPVWARTLRIDESLPDSAHRVGIQVRYKDGFSHYQKMNGTVNDRISRCLREEGLLSSPSDSTPSGVSGVGQNSRPNRTVAVFVASLYTGLHDQLSNLYGSSVRVAQASHEERQEFGVEVDGQALAEALCLSFADQLVVTPMSTFGGLAQGFGGLRPWLVEMRPNARKACTRSASAEVCYQGGRSKYSCPFDSEVDGESIRARVPYLSDCLRQDYAPGGLQLLTSND